MRSSQPFQARLAWGQPSKGHQCIAVERPTDPLMVLMHRSSFCAGCDLLGTGSRTPCLGRKTSCGHPLTFAFSQAGVAFTDAALAPGSAAVSEVDDVGREDSEAYCILKSGSNQVIHMGRHTRAHTRGCGPRLRRTYAKCWDGYTAFSGVSSLARKYTIVPIFIDPAIVGLSSTKRPAVKNPR